MIVGGSGPTDRNGEVGGTKVYRDLALGLAAKGFAVLRFDKRTYAYRDNIAMLEADRMGLREEYLDDTMAAVRLLAADPWVDASRLTLVGHSLGAWVLPLVVEALGGGADMVKRLVLIAPPGKDMGATLVRQLRFRLSLNPGRTDPRADDRRRRGRVRGVPGHGQHAGAGARRQGVRTGRTCCVRIPSAPRRACRSR